MSPKLYPSVKGLVSVSQTHWTKVQLVFIVDLGSIKNAMGKKKSLSIVELRNILIQTKRALRQEVCRRRKLETALKAMTDNLRTKTQELSDLRQNYQRLTPREREVMTLVVEGQLNKEIAAATGVTERTVKFHRRQIMDRMQAGSLAELVRMAERLQNYSQFQYLT